MVDQVPGFQLDDGTDQRGFGAAIGNVLINDRYPSAKQDTPTQILQRIPASQVQRIELIRGQVREIDLLGQTGSPEPRTRRRTRRPPFAGRPGCARTSRWHRWHRTVASRYPIA